MSPGVAQISWSRLSETYATKWATFSSSTLSFPVANNCGNKRSKRRLCRVELGETKFVFWCVIWEIILRDFLSLVMPGSGHRLFAAYPVQNIFHQVKSRVQEPLG